MTVDYKERMDIPDNVSMKQMASLLNMNRSRLYSLISEHILLPPIYSLPKRKPHYTSDMAQRNIMTKRNNIGMNGQVIEYRGQ